MSSVGSGPTGNAPIPITWGGYLAYGALTTTAAPSGLTTAASSPTAGDGGASSPGHLLHDSSRFSFRAFNWSEYLAHGVRSVDRRFLAILKTVGINFSGDVNEAIKKIPVGIKLAYILHSLGHKNVILLSNHEGEISRIGGYESWKSLLPGFEVSNWDSKSEIPISKTGPTCIKFNSVRVSEILEDHYKGDAVVPIVALRKNPMTDMFLKRKCGVETEKSYVRTGVALPRLSKKGTVEREAQLREFLRAVQIADLDKTRPIFLDVNE